jgi:hypothetical protein
MITTITERGEVVAAGVKVIMIMEIIKVEPVRIKMDRATKRKTKNRTIVG